MIRCREFFGEELVKDDQKNFVLFAVLAALILFGWPWISHMIWPQPPAATKIAGGKTTALPNPSADPTADTAGAIRDRAVVLRESPRVAIRTPRLQGSISLKGARIDDLVLTDYKETVDKKSPPIRLLSPSGTQDAYFAAFGWQGQGVKLPDANTVWTASGNVLAPGKPVTLTADNGAGQRFRIDLSVDENYMFTVRQTVANAGGAPVSIAPYALVNRSGASKDQTAWTNHVGPVSDHAGATDYSVDYKTIDKKGTQSFTTTGGWIGFTDKYWLTALVPDQQAAAAAQFRGGANGTYQADYALTPKQLAPGKQLSSSSRFFAGAKEVTVLDHYQNDEGIANFERAIDWGWFRVIEKPIFYYLDWLFRAIGNFGVSIILLTLTIRLMLFPIAQRQFASMAAMRALQPKMKALQARYKDDKPRLQQETMKLYKEEKVNPLAGCLPTLIQIPIMFALYKVLILTIEMRHQPFALWIKDLSAPDPLTPVNLFGLLPFVPPHFIAIGVVPIILGITMFFQFRLNPAPMDEMQKQVFSIMPWMMMFMMAPFAVGLQVYWITSNLLTIAQQQFLYSRHPQLRQKPAA